MTLFLNDSATPEICARSLADALPISGGALQGSGSVTVSGTLNWTGGTMNGAGTTTVPVGATLTLSGAAQKQLFETRTLNMQGSATMSGGPMVQNGSPTINNSGTWTLH